MRGAGGTSGGVGRFLTGLIMLSAGGYLFFQSITVQSSFGLGYSLYRVGAYNFTTGMVMIPFIFGVGMIFYNVKNIIGWLLSIASIIMLIAGVISSIHFSFRHMTAFELIIIIVLFFGGTGLFLSSLRNLE